MTTPALRVTAVGLRELAQRCEILSGQVAPRLSPVTASTWQTSGAAASTVNAGTSKAATALRGRMATGSNKLGTAAHEYVAMDNHAATALAAVPRGGAGITPVAPCGSGVDGGAAGAFGTPR
ncbi:MAG: hypothetical protein ABI253_12960 [Mycobacterium sp.]